MRIFACGRSYYITAIVINSWETYTHITMDLCTYVNIVSIRGLRININRFSYRPTDNISLYIGRNININKSYYYGPCAMQNTPSGAWNYICIGETCQYHWLGLMNMMNKSLGIVVDLPRDIACGVSRYGPRAYYRIDNTIMFSVAHRIVYNDFEVVSGWCY